jgi:GTP-binding protein
MFVDTATVMVRAGDGGNGIVSFRRERYVAKGGPDGGDGGDGGDIILIASRNEDTLANFRFQKELQAKPGAPGGNAKRHGKSGEDLVVSVPVGTQVWRGDDLVVDLVTDGDSKVIAQGGKGGFGNAHFTSSVRQAPKLAEHGEPGEEFEIRLELKIIADVGLVGLPNAGKSTLLAALSGAKPKIANYPFTTLNPHLGVVKVDSTHELLLADIPGLIEGASTGKGLGDEFLKHVERTEVILHLIDVYSNDVISDFKTIQKELRDYSVDLTKKPQVLALTKCEGLDREILADQKHKLEAYTDEDVQCISALSGIGVKELLYKLSTIVQEQKQSHKKDKKLDIPVIRAQEDVDAWHIEIKKNKVVITGEKIERFAKRTDFTSEDGVRRLRDIMRKLGIMKHLEKKNVAPGERVFFGDNAEDYLEF